MASCMGGLGVLPPGNFWVQGLLMVHSNGFPGYFTPISIPHPWKNSLQIYTDLKNGPGSWKKVWNQTQVWRFCPLLSPSSMTGSNQSSSSEPERTPFPCCFLFIFFFFLLPSSNSKTSWFYMNSIYMSLSLVWRYLSRDYINKNTNWELWVKPFSGALWIFLFNQ